MIELNLTYFVQLVSFLLFFFLMDRVFFKPVMASIASRRKYIEGNQAMIQQRLGEIDQLQKQYQEQLEQAKDDAQAIITAQRTSAEQRRQTLLKQVGDEMTQQLSQLRTELQDEREKVRVDLLAQIEPLADHIFQKVLESPQVANASKNGVSDAELVAQAPSMASEGVN